MNNIFINLDLLIIAVIILLVLTVWACNKEHKTNSRRKIEIITHGIPKDSE